MNDQQNSSERVMYLISLLKKLDPSIEYTEATPFNGAPLLSICKYDLGPYQRVKEWLEKKVSEVGAPTLKTEIQTDAEHFRREMDRCYELMVSRNAKYGDSFKKLRNNSIVDLCAMKLDRCQKQELDPKALEVEAEDVVNYMVFLLMSLRKD